jgi:hypothetical protein
MRHFSDESGIACGQNPDGTLELTHNKQAVDCPRCIQVLATMPVQISLDPFSSACDHDVKQAVVGTKPDGSADTRSVCVKCGDDSFPEDDIYDSVDISWNFVPDPPDQSSSDDDWYALHHGGRIKPESVLSDRSQIQRVRDAEAVLASFFSALREADIRTEM